MPDPEKGIAGWARALFRFGGLGTAPTVAHSDIVTASLAGPGVATTAARSDIVPIGVPWPWLTGTPPSGYILMDGGTASRTTYAPLFALWGTTFGIGDGSTTFGLPDWRGRAIIGAGTGSGLTARTLNATGGAETVTLSTGELPVHSHALRVNDGSGLFPLYGGGGGVSQPGGYWGRPGTEFPNSGATGVNAAGTDSSGGSGGAHANVQPFFVVNWITRAV